MSLIQTVHEVDYPESDGKPVAESDLHIDWMFRLRDILRWRYRDQRVYVASNLFVYYEVGDPTKQVAPDQFIALDCNPGRRRTFKIWEEGRSPDVAFEITSRSSKYDDQIYKPRIFAQIGIQEYFVYDPSSEYLRPPLQGFQLVQGNYQRMEADDAGALTSEVLGVTLRLDDADLVITDSLTGEVLLTEAEAKEAARRHAEAARQQADKARRQAEKERRQAEAERKRADKERRRAEAERQQVEAAFQEEHVRADAAEKLAAQLQLEQLRSRMKDAPPEP